MHQACTRSESHTYTQFTAAALHSNVSHAVQEPSDMGKQGESAEAVAAAVGKAESESGTAGAEDGQPGA